MEPPPPPVRRTVNASGSFESTGISKNPGEPELSYIQPNPLSVEIEGLQAGDFVRNYNSLLIGLVDLVINTSKYKNGITIPQDAKKYRNSGASNSSSTAS